MWAKTIVTLNSDYSVKSFFHRIMDNIIDNIDLQMKEIGRNYEV